MSVVKISELVELDAAPSDADLFVIVDQTLNETKKIQYSTLFGSPSMTSATIGTAAITTANTATENISVEVNFADSAKANFGADDDLQIYHDGTNSYISDVGTGSLIVKSSDDFFIRSATDENYFSASVDGAATLYHDNTARLATSATGVSITGDTVTDGALEIDGAFTGASTIEIANGTTALPALTFSGDTNTGFRWISDGVIGYSANASHLMTIDSTNGLYYGYTAESSGIPLTNQAYVKIKGDYSDGIYINNAVNCIHTNDSTGGYNAAKFTIGGVLRGYIDVQTSATSYYTTSDHRLKENVIPMVGSVDRVAALKPCRFNFIGDARIVDGFLAHEAQAVVPESVSGVKDEVDDDGNPIYQAIDQSKLVPLLVGAIQELKARIEALESGV